MIMLIVNVDDFSVLLKADVRDTRISILKCHFGEGQHILGILDHQQQKLMLIGILVLEETVQLIVLVEPVVDKLAGLGNDLSNFLRLVSTAETDDIDLLVVGEEQIFLSETDVPDYIVYKHTMRSLFNHNATVLKVATTYMSCH